MSQCDLPSDSGLRTVVDLIKHCGLPVPIIEFSMSDVVRSDTCAMWVRAFEGGKVEQQRYVILVTNS